METEELERTDTLEAAAEREQVQSVETGNQMAAIAASQVNYHVMGYFPITPSTEIAEYLDEMRVKNEHDIVIDPGRWRARRRRHLLWRQRGRWSRHQRHLRQRLPLRLGTDAGAVRHAHPHGPEPGLPGRLGSAGYPRRPLRPLLCA